MFLVIGIKNTNGFFKASFIFSRELDFQIFFDMKENFNLDKKTVIRFVVVYLALIGIMELFLGLHYFQKLLDLNGIYSGATAWISARLLSAAGIEVTSAGPLVHLPGRSLYIAFGCNGLEAVVIYGAAILAYPATFLYKLKGLIGGLVVLQVVNIIRIVVLGIAAVKFGKWFDYIHYYIAQGLMIAIALGLFILWLRGTTRAHAS